MTYHPIAYKPLIAASLKVVLTENGEVRTVDVDEGEFESGGGSADIAQVQVDFGPIAVRSKTFTITDAQVTPSTQIIATQAGDAPTGKNADDNEMDAILFRAVPGAGQFTLYATVVEGFKVGGFYKVNYLKG